MTYDHLLALDVGVLFVLCVRMVVLWITTNHKEY